MKKIGLKDLKLVEVVVEPVVEKRQPLFLGMDKKDIFRIQYFDTCIIGYNGKGLEIYFEHSDKYWRKREDSKKIEHINGKYYIDGKEAVLIS